MKTDSYLEKLYEVSLEIDLSTDPCECLEKVLGKIATIGLRNGMIRILDKDDENFDGEDGEINGQIRGAIMARVAGKGTPLIALLDDGERTRGGKVAYLICVPVYCGHDIMAVLAAERESPGVDELEKDLQLLSILSRLLADPVQQVRSGTCSGERYASGSMAVLSLTRRVENFERELIVDALRKTRGNQTKAAALLGISLRIINYRINKLNLDYRRFRKVN